MPLDVARSRSMSTIPMPLDRARSRSMSTIPLPLDVDDPPAAELAWTNARNALDGLRYRTHWLPFDTAMNPELILVLGLLLTCVGLFVANRPRMDVVALLVIVILPLCGVISVSEAFAGFSDPNVMLIAAMFVIGEGLCGPELPINWAIGWSRRLVAMKRAW